MTDLDRYADPYQNPTQISLEISFILCFAQQLQINLHTMQSGNIIGKGESRE